MKFMFYLSVFLCMFFFVSFLLLPLEAVSFSLFGLWFYVALMVKEEIEQNK